MSTSTACQSQSSPYLGGWFLRLVIWTTALVGIGSVVGALVALVQGVASSPRHLTVPVRLIDGASAAQVQEALPPGVSISSWNNGPVLDVPHPARLEILLSHGGDMLLGLAFGVAALLIWRLLRSVAVGDPFGGGNAVRLGLLGVVSLVAVVFAPFLPQAGALLTVLRLDLHHPFSASLTVTSGLPIFLPLTFLVLAEAFRQGERLHRDVEGLV